VARIITFGCSFTYGQGLPDCDPAYTFRNTLLTNTANPSKFGWATLLGEKLGLEVVNLGEPGISNTEILYNLLEFRYQPNDIVIVMWSNYPRDIMFTKGFVSKNTNTRFSNLKRGFFNKRLAIWAKGKDNKQWIKYMSEHDYCVKTQMHMHHADLFFRSLDVSYIHYPCSPHELEEVSLEFLPVHNACYDGLFWVDITPDGHHGIESNKLVADNIINFLKERKIYDTI
jgi:hypothetical protein